MACAVREFVKRRAVILCRLFKLSQEGKRYGVGERTVESPVAFLMDQLDTASLDVFGNDFVGFGVGVCSRGKLLHMLCGQAFALIDMEDVVVTQEGNLLLFVRLFVLLFDELPEHNHVRLLALLDLAALLLTLGKGQVFAAAPKQHLIQKGIGFACCSADGASACDPRFLPRDDSLFHLVDDSIRDFCVNIHDALLLLIAGSKDLW